MTPYVADGGWVAAKDCDIDITKYQKVKSSVKYMVLDLAAENGPIDYKTLSDITGMPTDYAADRLIRYARAGVLSRSREGDGGLSQFEITAKGRERLRYFDRQ